MGHRVTRDKKCWTRIQLFLVSPSAPLEIESHASSSENKKVSSLTCHLTPGFLFAEVSLDHPYITGDPFSFVPKVTLMGQMYELKSQHSLFCLTRTLEQLL